MGTAAPGTTAMLLSRPPPRSAGGADPRSHGIIRALDGWRGISMLCVLACHMLPLGPHRWQLNECAGPVGMALFFTLSGFLITSTLIERLSVREFFIRRACRILPLALLFMAVALAVLRAGPVYYLSHLLFIINYDTDHMTGLTGHLWSVCVEVQFYVFIGLLVAATGRRGLLVIPLVCVGITALRVWDGALISLKTHLRVDEILAGSCLALAYHGRLGARIRGWLAPADDPDAGTPARGHVRLLCQAVLLALLLIASHPDSGAMNYIRPYCATLLVGTTLAPRRSRLDALLASRWLKYIAAISYALYIVHPATLYGWMGTGGKVSKYLLKRPISVVTSFALAHVSTFHYEKRWIAWGKRMGAKWG